MRTTWERLRDLPLAVESADLRGLEARTPAGKTLERTVVRLVGAGCEGVGEDVGYDSAEQRAQRAAGPPAGLAGRTTLASFSARLDELALWPAPPAWEPARDFRRWAYESAALDLALAQAGLALHAVLERTPRPVRFVVSRGLGSPPRAAELRALQERDPRLRVKLDWSPEWDAALVRELAATGAVEVVDFKGHYHGTEVDRSARPEDVALVARGLPDAWLEDVRVDAEVEAALAGELDRLTWDAPLHRLADLDALERPPRMVNLKPSRFGRIEELCRVYDACAERGVAAYGGGQFELGPGRGQAQLLASLFHPDGPNDLAPGVFNRPELPERLPSSPLAPAPVARGFRWAEGGSEG